MVTLDPGSGSLFGMRRKRYNPEENGVGLSMMAALSVFGVHSAANPSVFTLLSFSNSAVARRRADIGVAIGAGAGLMTAYAIYRVFGKKTPAYVAAATALGMAGISLLAIHGGQSSGGPNIEEQPELYPANPPQPTVQQQAQVQQPRAGLPAPQR